MFIWQKSSKNQNLRNFFHIGKSHMAEKKQKMALFVSRPNSMIENTKKPN